jgi:hypothetical protein
MATPAGSGVIRDANLQVRLVDVDGRTSGCSGTSWNNLLASSRRVRASQPVLYNPSSIPID